MPVINVNSINPRSSGAWFDFLGIARPQQSLVARLAVGIVSEGKEGKEEVKEAKFSENSLKLLFE